MHTSCAVCSQDSHYTSHHTYTLIIYHYIYVYSSYIITNTHSMVIVQHYRVPRFIRYDIGHFPPIRPTAQGSFGENDLDNNELYEFSQPCIYDTSIYTYIFYRNHISPFIIYHYTSYMTMHHVSLYIIYHHR